MLSIDLEDEGHHGASTLVILVGLDARIPFQPFGESLRFSSIEPAFIRIPVVKDKHSASLEVVSDEVKNWNR